MREENRLIQKKKCEQCIYYHSLGGSSYACRKIIHDTFALSNCLRNNFKYFTPFAAPDSTPINLFTDIFQSPYASPCRVRKARVRVPHIRFSQAFIDEVRTGRIAIDFLTEREEELLDSLLDDAINGS